ncbi:SDR family oxidoreductase [Jiangella asiatica]|uniref:SDR family oxidoreductase n=1 Tax=Jiangella asiatica TaxID=2530372 RepID=A0A4R5DMD1_9ACTN|nr:SDR family oxidoreductase [Jiangella asiatica]TDE11833.1 SDR family oxidoreductase [Jiangella asiatica]
MHSTPERRLGSMAGRVALVTGASSGIGAAIAREFVAAGARVHGAARRADAIVEQVGADAVARERCVPHALDVGDPVAVDDLAARLHAEDPVDTLVCAAGFNVTDRRLAQLTNEAWDELVRVNLSGTFYVLRAVLDQLRERQGDLVVISSVAGSWPDHSGPGYGATKSGLLGLARGAGIDEHANGVRVSTILPGIVNTPILDDRPVPPSPELREWCVQPEDVAAACLCAVTLPARANIAEMTIVATRLQSLGKTQNANPQLPEEVSPHGTGVRQIG